MEYFSMFDRKKITLTIREVLNSTQKTAVKYVYQAGTAAKDTDYKLLTYNFCGFFFLVAALILIASNILDAWNLSSEIPMEVRHAIFFGVSLYCTIFLWLIVGRTQGLIAIRCFWKTTVIYKFIEECRERGRTGKLPEPVLAATISKKESKTGNDTDLRSNEMLTIAIQCIQMVVRIYSRENISREQVYKKMSELILNAFSKAGMAERSYGFSKDNICNKANRGKKSLAGKGITLEDFESANEHLANKSYWTQKK